MWWRTQEEEDGGECERDKKETYSWSYSGSRTRFTLTKGPDDKKMYFRIHQFVQVEPARTWQIIGRFVPQGRHPACADPAHNNGRSQLPSAAAEREESRTRSSTLVFMCLLTNSSHVSYLWQKAFRILKSASLFKSQTDNIHIERILKIILRIWQLGGLIWFNLTQGLSFENYNLCIFASYQTVYSFILVGVTVMWRSGDNFRLASNQTSLSRSHSPPSLLSITCATSSVCGVSVAVLQRPPEAWRMQYSVGPGLCVDYRLD